MCERGAEGCTDSDCLCRKQLSAANLLTYRKIKLPLTLQNLQQMRLQVGKQLQTERQMQSRCCCQHVAWFIWRVAHCLLTQVSCLQ